MGLLSIFQRNKQTAAKPAPAGRAGKAPVRQAPLVNSQNPADTAEAVREARARARRRLMGATVLLLVGVIGFPLLFETQPRPIPVDLPIEIPSRNAAGVADTGVPPARSNGAATAMALSASGSAAESVSYDARQASAAAPTAPASAGPTSKPSAFASLAAAFSPRSSDAAASVASPAVAVAVAVAVAATAASMPSSTAQSRAYINPAMRPGKHTVADAQASAVKPPTIALTPPAPASKPSVAPVQAPPQTQAPSPTSGSTAAALLAGGAPSDAAPGTTRFVVQIGAFADDTKMRDARGKVEKLGLKTYTQSVDTPGGKRVRVRVGPFATKAEADRTASKIKADGLPAAVLVL